MHDGDGTQARWVQLLVVAALTAALVTPIALANAEGPRAASAAKPASVAKGLKALRKRALTLVKRVAALKAENAALEQRGSPTSAPPAGPAGGDLAGTYPNPRLAANAVGPREVADSSVSSAKIADGTITTIDLAPGAIGSAQVADGTIAAGQIAPEAFHSRNLKTFFAYPRAGENVGTPVIPGGSSVQVFITCPGESRIISGGWEWGNLDGNETAILRSSPARTDPMRSWEIIAKIDPGGNLNTIFPEALCLSQ
jgi:hypothetical protein